MFKTRVSNGNSGSVSGRTFFSGGNPSSGQKSFGRMPEIYRNFGFRFIFPGSCYFPRKNSSAKLEILFKTEPQLSLYSNLGIETFYFHRGEKYIKKPDHYDGEIKKIPSIPKQNKIMGHCIKGTAYAMYQCSIFQEHLFYELSKSANLIQVPVKKNRRKIVKLFFKNIFTTVVKRLAPTQYAYKSFTTCDIIKILAFFGKNWSNAQKPQRFIMLSALF